VYRATHQVYGTRMQPLVIEYLRDRTFAELEEAHGVCARPNSTFDKFSLNYDQILAKNGDPVSEQCRGMVIRPHADSDVYRIDRVDWKHAVVGDASVLAWPMKRFYNFGDSAVAPVDWNDPGLRVYEKVDGTCIICYWDPLHGKWHAATRSVPEADLPIRSDDLEIGDMTFAQLFLKALILTREAVSGKLVDWAVDGPDKVVELNKAYTYVFELVSRHNQIVVDYPAPRVYLLAARHLPTGREVPIEEIDMEYVRRPKVWPLKDAVSVGAFVNAAKPSDLEGAVACDGDFNRMKIKNFSHVIAHRAKDSITSSSRNALEAIIAEKIDDVIPIVPKEVGDKMLQMQAAYGKFCGDIDRDAAQFRAAAAGSRKAYAVQVIASGRWTPPFFQLWEGKVSSTRELLRGNFDRGKLPASTIDAILSHLAIK